MHKRIRRFTASAAATLAAFAGATAAPALADMPDPSMEAYCSTTYVSAEAPDIHWQPQGWAVQYRFRVAKYTSAGWSNYYIGSWRTHYSTDWSAPGWFGAPAPANTYIQVTVDEYFYYNGVYQGYRYRLPTHSSRAYNLATTAYCRTG